MTSRRKRLILLLGSVITACWIGVRGIPSVFKNWQEARWEVQDRARLLTRSQSEIASEKALFDLAGKVKEGMVGLASQLVAGQTGAQASDALTALLNVVAVRSNTKLTGTSPVEDSTAVGTLRRVAIHAALDGDIRGVSALLQSLAEEQTMLTTDDLRILVAGDGAPNAMEVLRVEVTVRGWYLADGSLVSALVGQAGSDK
jgi:hypothetical protein